MNSEGVGALSMRHDCCVCWVRVGCVQLCVSRYAMCENKCFCLHKSLKVVKVRGITEKNEWEHLWASVEVINDYPTSMGSIVI